MTERKKTPDELDAIARKHSAHSLSGDERKAVYYASAHRYILNALIDGVPAATLRTCDELLATDIADTRAAMDEAFSSPEQQVRMRERFMFVLSLEE